MNELNKFYDKRKNVWEVREELDLIILLKNGKKMVFFINNKSGQRLLKMKIKELKK